MSAPRSIPWPLVALFTAGYLAPYLLPTTVGRLATGLPLTTTEAGAIGSALLLSSASAGFLLAGRAERIGARTLARLGLVLAVLGYGGAALTGAVPAVVAGAVAGGFGSGTVTAVAARGIAGRRDPHRATTAGLLCVSALAGALYLTIPHLGPGHGWPLAAIALTALVVWPAAGRLPAADPAARTVAGASAPLPHRRAGLLLAATMPCWSLAQNSLWGVSGRIGLGQAHLTEVTVGAVFALALGGGLLGVIGAGALGPRLGRALPIGLGTVLIAACVARSASATDLPSFASGEIAWNVCYPVVLSYVIGLAASLDPRGRWAVLVGSAASLGTAAGPLAGSLLSARAGFAGMGAVLAALLLVAAVPMTAVALRTAAPRPARTALHRRAAAIQVVEIQVAGLPAAQPPARELPALELPVRELPVRDLPVDARTLAGLPPLGVPDRVPASAGASAEDFPAVEERARKLPLRRLPVAVRAEEPAAGLGAGRLPDAGVGAPAGVPAG